MNLVLDFRVDQHHSHHEKAEHVFEISSKFLSVRYDIQKKKLYSTIRAFVYLNLAIAIQSHAHSKHIRPIDQSN